MNSTNYLRLLMVGVAALLLNGCAAVFMTQGFYADHHNDGNLDSPVHNSNNACSVHGTCGGVSMCDLYGNC